MRTVILLCFVLLSGCITSGYRQFYHELPGARDMLASRANPAPSVPALEHAAGKFADVYPEYLRAGYEAIGYSAYNGLDGRDSEALAVGKQVGADLVVVMNPRFTETVSTTIPLTLPSSQTTYTSGNATVIGSGGTASIYGNSTSTTYGSQTTYIPITARRYDFEAVYLVKRKFKLGAFFEPLTDEERASIQSNKGVRISEIVDNTPAFEADILVGDIVVEANGRSVSSVEAFDSVLRASGPGEQLELKIIRNGESLTKIMQLH